MEGIIEVKTADIVAAETRADIDAQVATAKMYPRNLTNVLSEIETMATLDEETAMECFYVLPRSGKDIEGVSVRLAEIIASAWGNLRVQTRITANDGKMITAQSVCHDLEKNVAIAVEVKRRITDKYGKTYNEDMQVVTGNAASAIAFRNAVLKVIPKAVTKRTLDTIKKVSLGNAADMTTRRRNVVAFYSKFNITEEQLLQFLEIDKIDRIDAEMLFQLQGIANAIREGSTTAQESILDVIKERENEAKAKAAKSEAESKVMEAMNKQK